MFDNEIKKIENKEAVEKIKAGRETTYKLIDMLYRTDWNFDKK